jgi:prolycopene isomerase
MRPEAWENVKPTGLFRTKTLMATGYLTVRAGTKLSIRKHIEEIEISTPETYARYTGTYNGIIYGYEMEPWDSVIPRMLSIQDEKYIDGLYFAGGFSFRALGYSSSLLSGQTTALLTLKKGGLRYEIQRKIPDFRNDTFQEPRQRSPEPYTGSTATPFTV